MMKMMFYFGFFLLISACNESTTAENQTENSGEEKETVEAIAERYVTSTLKIPVNENFTFEILKADLDGDAFEDAIITVNRLEFAKEEIAKKGKLDVLEKYGFMGTYNYLFYYDGSMHQISPPIGIASSAIVPLKVSFEKIQSDAYFDVLVDYRIQNASYKNFYTIKNHAPKLVFQWKNFSNLGEAKHEAYVFEYAPGTKSIAKDIRVLKATFEDPKNNESIQTFEPKLMNTNTLAYRFFYDLEQGKYFTVESK